MTQRQFEAAEIWVEGQLSGSVHGVAHTQRVLNHALRLLATEPKANPDVVILAALLHDVGRGPAGGALPGPHAASGAALAHAWLAENGWDAATAAQVRACIATHSYKGRKGDTAPQSLEAKILFDADKLDQTGAVGVVRHLLEGTPPDTPVYGTAPGGLPLPGKKGEGRSLYRDYRKHLKKQYQRFFHR